MGPILKSISKANHSNWIEAAPYKHWTIADNTAFVPNAAEQKELQTNTRQLQLKRDQL